MADVTQRSAPAIIRGATPLAPAAPAGVADGDWVVMLVSIRGGTAAACPTPAGWTAMTGSPWTSGGAVVNTDAALFGFRRRWDSSWAMPSVAWSGDGANNATLTTLCFAGADSSSPLDLAAVPSSGAFVSNSSAVLTGLTTLTDRAYVWHFFTANSGATALTVPDTSDGSNINRPMVGVAHAGVQTPAGPTGTKTYSWTGGANAAWVGIVVAMRPAPAPTVHQLGATLQGVATMPADIKPARTLAGALQGVAQVTPTLQVVAAGGRGPEDYETAVGPLVQVAAMSRRAGLYVTTGDFPGTVIPPPGSAMKAGLYVGRGASSPPAAQLHHQADGTARTTRLDSFDPAGDPPPGGNFPAGQPATLATEDGSPLIRATGMPRVRLQLGSNLQSPASGVDTVLPWNSEDVDTDGFWAAGVPEQVLIPFKGQFLVQWTLAWAANATGRRTSELQRSTDGGANWTTLMSYADRRNAVASGQTTNNFGGMLTAQGGYRFRLRAFQDSGGALTINVGYIALLFLGPE